MHTAVVVRKNEHLGWWVVCQPTTCFDLVSVKLCYNLLELYLFHHMAESCRRWWKALGASGFGHLAQDWLFAMLCFLWLSSMVSTSVLMVGTSAMVMPLVVKDMWLESPLLEMVTAWHFERECCLSALAKMLSSSCCMQMWEASLPKGVNIVQIFLLPTL